MINDLITLPFWEGSRIYVLERVARHDIVNSETYGKFCAKTADLSIETVKSLQSDRDGICETFLPWFMYIAEQQDHS